jgi:tyrosinase
MKNNLSTVRRQAWALLLCATLLMAAACGDEIRIRKNAKDLTEYEKWSYTDAIRQLKAAPSPYSDTLSYYDSFVRFHQMAVELKTQRYLDSGCDDNGNFGVAHANPAFPPWHRKLLIVYEDALREVSGRNITLPYWDWTDPASTAATFAPDLMGGNGDPNEEWAVTDGPFQKGVFQVNLKTTIASYQGQNDYDHLVRNFAATLPDLGLPGYPVSLPTVPEVEFAYSLTEYDVAPYTPEADPNVSFRSYLEGFKNPVSSGQRMHNIGHDWIAGFFQVPVDSLELDTIVNGCQTVIVRNDTRVGSMEPLDVSPNDPAFFMHHANVDRIWYFWQQIGDNLYKYTNSGMQGQDIDDDMYPFDQFKGSPQMDAHGYTPRDMLNSDSLDVIYQ